MRKKTGNVFNDVDILFENAKDTKDALDNKVGKRLSELQYNLDWNDLTETGQYIYNGWAGSGGSHRPTDTKCMGSILVSSKDDMSIIVQTFFRSSGEIYTRMYAGGNWGDWSQN